MYNYELPVCAQLYKPHHRRRTRRKIRIRRRGRHKICVFMDGFRRCKEAINLSRPFSSCCSVFIYF